MLGKLLMICNNQRENYKIVLVLVSSFFQQNDLLVKNLFHSRGRTISFISFFSTST